MPNFKPESPKKIQNNFLKGAEKAIAKCDRALYRGEGDSAMKEYNETMRGLEVDAITSIMGVRFITEAEREIAAKIGEIVKDDMRYDQDLSNKILVGDMKPHEIGLCYLQHNLGSKSRYEKHQGAISAIKGVEELKKEMKKSGLLGNAREEIAGTERYGAPIHALILPKEVENSSEYKEYRKAFKNYEQVASEITGGLEAYGIRVKQDSGFGRKMAVTLLSAFCAVVVAAVALAPAIALTATGVLPAIAVAGAVVLGCVTAGIMAHKMYHEVDYQARQVNGMDKETRKYFEAQFDDDFAMLKRCAKTLQKLADKEPKLDLDNEKKSHVDKLAERAASKSGVVFRV